MAVRRVTILIIISLKTTFWVCHVTLFTGHGIFFQAPTPSSLPLPCAMGASTWQREMNHWSLNINWSLTWHRTLCAHVSSIHRSIFTSIITSYIIIHALQCLAIAMLDPHLKSTWVWSDGVSCGLFLQRIKGEGSLHILSSYPSSYYHGFRSMCTES